MSLLVLIGPCIFFMGFNGFLLVFIGPYASLMVLITSYKS